MFTPQDTLFLIIAFVILGLYFVILGLAVLSWVLTSLSLHKIAARRQIKYPWLAWIPYASNWTLGHIADEYDGRNGIQRKWRVLLLVLSLIFAVGFAVVYAVMMVSIFTFAFRFEYAEPTPTDVLGLIVPLYLSVLLMMLVGVAQRACATVCVFKVFESTVPKKAVLYLLLWLLVPLAGPICLFKCRYQGYSNLPTEPPYPTTPPTPQPELPPAETSVQ